MNNTSFDSYITEGCGRCERFRTPSCKALQWAPVIHEVRALLQQTELVEQMRWGMPCYALETKNVASLSALNDACVLGFFRGAVLDDPRGLLEKPGPNSRHARRVRFTSSAQVSERRDAVMALVADAIDAVRTGRKVEGAPDDAVPDELAERMAHDDVLRAAFERLTPGRKRSHILYVGGAKQAATRHRRVDKCAEKILAGRGFNER